jgi:hypothetical protein
MIELESFVERITLRPDHPDTLHNQAENKHPQKGAFCFCQLRLKLASKRKLVKTKRTTRRVVFVFYLQD